MQLYGLLGTLLPWEEGKGLDISPELEDILDADEHSPLNLRALRASGVHQFRFSGSLSGNPLVHLLMAGDYGYISDGSMDLASFVLLGNIQDSEYRKDIPQVVDKAKCKLFASEHDPVKCHRSSPPAATSSISDEGECWLVPPPPNGPSFVRVSYETRLNPKHGREFLVARGASLASKHGVEAKDLILVTLSLRDDHYSTTEWSRLSHTRHATEFDSTASDSPAFPVPVLPAEMLSEPSMLYLVTSSRTDFQAYVTDEPLGALSQHPTNSSSSHIDCNLWGQEETVDYVQLDKEDMVS